MEEVSPDSSTAQRSQTTGKLLITMPRAKPVVKSAKSAIASSKVGGASHMTTGVGGASSRKESTCSVASKAAGGLLEVDPNLSSKRAELTNIIVGQPSAPLKRGDSPKLSRRKEPVPPSPDFIDDPDVPPLI